MTGHNAPSYEVCAVRCFRFGRTAAIRPCSEDSAAWVDKMLEGSIGNEKECYDLLNTAV